MGLFQGHALHGCLQIPPGLSLPEVHRHFCVGLLLCGLVSTHVGTLLRIGVQSRCAVLLLAVKMTHNHMRSCLQEQRQQQSGDGAVTADSAAAERLKGELVQLRAAIRAARSEVRQTHAQIAAMDRDLVAHGAYHHASVAACQIPQPACSKWPALQVVYRSCQQQTC